jgi:hypothetical protein
VRDGIAAARRGRPVVVVVTEDFRPQADFVAASEGMPDVPRVIVPHPIAGAPDEDVRAAAVSAAPDIAALLRGRS